jgi:RNA polymerase sigma-70 factor (ECF subfamily)
VSELTDRQVVEAVLSGDADAYRILVDRYQQRVYRSLCWMCGSSADAEELTQETFVRAYYALASHKTEYKSSTWLLQIARNQCINFMKRRDREMPYEADRPPASGTFVNCSAPAQPVEQAERVEHARRLWLAVAKLPPDFRDIVVMRHVSEMSYTEICDVTGLPMGTVKSRLARARRRLLEALSKELEPSI